MTDALGAWFAPSGCTRDNNNNDNNNNDNNNNNNNNNDNNKIKILIGCWCAWYSKEVYGGKHNESIRRS